MTIKRAILGSGTVAVLLMILTACGAGGSATGSHAAAQGSNTKANAAAKCDPAIMVNIAGDAYDRKSVDLDMGNTLLVPMEMEHVPFNKPGSFTLSSREHPTTTVQVNVSSKQNYTCGEKPVATINVASTGAFSQQNVTVPQGQSILVPNDPDSHLMVRGAAFNGAHSGRGGRRTRDTPMTSRRACCRPRGQTRDYCRDQRTARGWAVFLQPAAPC